MSATSVPRNYCLREVNSVGICFFDFSTIMLGEVPAKAHEETNYSRHKLPGLLITLWATHIAYEIYLAWNPFWLIACLHSLSDKT